jgi:flagellar basal-body rod modification protein FlgD
MTIDSISQATNPSKSEIAGEKLSDDYSFFLKMLTTQLKNQDPTEPMDVSQMTQQIAQYSSVEQQVATNSNLEKLLSQQRQSQLSTAVSYIGREVETLGNTGTLDQGQAVFSYKLPQEAGSVQVTISDSTGRAVWQGDAPTSKGRNVVIWAGQNSFIEDKIEPAGKYTITVKAKDTAGKDMTSETYAVGVVNTVETDKDGNVMLTVGDVVIKYEEIIAVREATPLLGTDPADDETEGDDTAENTDETSETEENA